MASIQFLQAAWIKRPAGILPVLILLALAAPLAGAAEPGGAEDLEARRALGQVYWDNREWPETNAGAKPAYRDAVSDAELLAQWQAVEARRDLLQRRWGIEITPSMLQRELNRIAASTRDAARLTELFDALGNDPQRIAKHIALPVLVERLAEKNFESDGSIHRQTLNAIDDAWKAGLTAADFRALGAETESWRRGRPEAGHDARRLTDDEWEMVTDRLRMDLDVETLQAGLVSPMLQDRSSFYRVAVERADGDHLTILRKAWPKQTLNSFMAQDSATTTAAGTGGNRENGDRLEPIPLPPGSIELPTPDDAVSSCTDDSWRGPIRQQPGARFGHTAVWTGSEMLIWGGFHRGSFGYDDGGRYDPVTDTWTVLPSANSAARTGHTAVWTGTEMLIWGGSVDDADAGLRYNPTTNTWSSMSTTNMPATRDLHVAVWTGTEMIVWGGWDFGGGRYNPATDTWGTMNQFGPTEAPYSTAVWTGNEMIVWGGGEDAFSITGDSGRYDPVTDTWSSLQFFPQEDRARHTAVWTGNEMIIWSGIYLEFDPETEEEFELPSNTGAMYDPVTDSWTSIFGPNSRWAHTSVWTGSEMLIFGGNDSPVNLESFDPVSESFTTLPNAAFVINRTEHTMIWTGTEAIIWGGVDIFNPFFPIDTGLTWTPGTSSWGQTYADAIPNPRSNHSAVWTGSEMFIFGGRSEGGGFENGGIYDPSLNSWSSYSTTNVPSFRQRHRSVWTGTEVIVWGGLLADWLGTGGRYNPATDTWTDTTTVNAPAARGNHSMTWTGSEMLVWGGGASGLFNDGGRYDPTTDSWTAMSTVGAPSARNSTPFLWTGTEAIVWAGSSTGDGARYNPATDSWTPMSSTGAPSARGGHTGVWTGTEAIFWGGSTSSSGGDTGGRYNPATDSWQPTSLTGVPTPRLSHTAVWTGEEMVVWGGRQNSTDWDNGGRYDPVTDSWTSTTQTDAPTGRYAHSAVFTGNEMVVFGGQIDTTFFNPTHGAYCASSACTPLTWFEDLDSDGFGNPLVTLSDCTQPAGYVAVAGDCNDGDGNVWATPGEVSGVQLAKGLGSVVDILWSDPANLGGQPGSLEFDTLRADDPSDFLSAVCLETDGSDNASTDTSDPAAGSLFAYLVRAGNACPAEGTLGTDSDGTERTGAVCP
ncbi:hypothetical protein ABI59_08610 [Acidobacteria bacterium Mor1]|nr:hypothetical protein ABI59_08610 [Acidobacteria bacterium Mor1]